MEEARTYVEENVDDGVICPCCDGQVKRYRRTIYRAMAIWMILLVRLYRTQFAWVHSGHVEKLRQSLGIEANFRGGDPAKLAYWKLTREMINEDTKKRTSGFWQPTEHGMKFADGKLAVRRRAVTLHNRVLWYEGEKRFISASFRNPFDYKKIMEGNP